MVERNIETRTRPKTARSKQAPAAATPAQIRHVTPRQRHRMIAENAYFRAERRGFFGGSPHEDWCEAEAEIDTMLVADADRD